MLNIQLHPTRKMVLPNDRVTKKIFSAPSPERYRKRITGEALHNVIEMEKHPKFGEILTPVQYHVAPVVAAEDPSVMEILSQFDNDVANVCISEWEAGNRYVTYSTIYRTLTGKVGESDANPSKVQLAAIKHSLKKLMNVKLEIFLYDVCEKLGYNNGEKKYIKGYIIPARFVDCTVNGQKTSVIELTEESPILTMAHLKNDQLLTYNVELLNMPNQKNTPLNIALKHYAIRRVIETKMHPKQMFPAITFNDVLTKCHIADADNKKKHRVRESLKAVFEHLLNCGEIDSFQVNKKKGVFHSISFTFSKGKKPTVDQANKIESKPAKVTPSIKHEEPEKMTDAKKQEDLSVEWHPTWSMEMMPLYPWEYRLNTMGVSPSNHGGIAFARFIKINSFFLY